MAYQYNCVSKDLPLLPGNVYADPYVTRHHKTQIMGLTNGVITGKYRWLFALTFEHREHQQPARGHKRRHAAVHARRRCHWPRRYQQSRTTHQRRCPQRCPRLAQTRQTGKYLTLHFKTLLSIQVIRKVTALFPYL